MLRVPWSGSHPSGVNGHFGRQTGHADHVLVRNRRPENRLDRLRRTFIVRLLAVLALTVHPIDQRPQRLQPLAPVYVAFVYQPHSLFDFARRRRATAACARVARRVLGPAGIVVKFATVATVSGRHGIIGVRIVPIVVSDITTVAATASAVAAILVHHQAARHVRIVLRGRRVGVVALVAHHVQREWSRTNSEK